MAARTAALAVALVAAASSVTAHTIVTSVWVNGKDTADGAVGVGSTYMRTPSSNSPVQDLASASLACNDKGQAEAKGFLSVAAGDTIEPEWWHAGARGADPIDASHKGPLTTWISPYDANTKGDVWVEIASEAYYKDSSEWAVSHMIANKGRNTVKIPSTLAPGKYLVRFDLLALHSAGSAGGAQFYPNCAQIEVTGSGKTELPAGVSIPGFFTEKTPGIVWIYYSSSHSVTLDYVAPGTGVWDGSSTYSTDTCTETVYGLAPAGYCQGGSNSTAPAVSSTSKAPWSTAATSSAVVSSTSTRVSSFAASSSAVTFVKPTTTAITTVAGSTQPASSSQAATTTSSAAGSSYTDYNSCMSAYNKCLDAHQPKNGGAADFSACYSSFNCATLQKRVRRAPHLGSRRTAAHRA